MFSFKVFLLGFIFLVPLVNAWFGSKDQFKCRCSVDKCNSDGSCQTGSTCVNGWFGPACQYGTVQYVSEVFHVDSEWHQIAFPKDIPDTSSKLRLKFPSDFVFTWMRIKLKKPNNFKKPSFQLKKKEALQSCTKQSTIFVDDSTLDFHCEGLPSVDKMVVYLGNTTTWSIKDILVSRGRNVAVRQPTNQTSTGDWCDGSKYKPCGSSRAVDGNTDAIFYRGNSCTHTSGDDEPRWNLYYDKVELINEIVIYNRDTDGDRLKGFIVNAVDSNGRLVLNRTSDVDKPVYSFWITNQSLPHHDIKSVSIRLPREEILTLCEVETYGDSDCPSNKYGLQCNKTCHCAEEEDCYVSTGSCPSGCPKGFHGEGCLQECDNRHYGKDCTQPCSFYCSSGACDRTNGYCAGGCIAGYQPPKCVDECPDKSYGINCTQTCSVKCKDQLCNASTGHCLACPPGYQGDDCTEECPEGYYGDGCQSKCSDLCKDAQCDHVNGLCDDCPVGKTGANCKEDCPDGSYGGKRCRGKCSKHCGGSGLCDKRNGSCLEQCKTGYRGDLCQEECTNNTFGMNCSKTCGKNCRNSKEPSQASVCHHETGYCFGCQNGFYGKDCLSRERASSSINPGVVAGPIVGLLLVLLVALGLILFVRRRKSRVMERGIMESQNRAEISNAAIHNTAVRQPEPSHFDRETLNQPPIHTVPSNPDGIYFNLGKTMTLDSSIAVKDLDAFMNSHSKEYFTEQFQSVPPSDGLSIAIGMSPENKHKNRYKNICAYDHSRVHLHIDFAKKREDYINASFVPGHNGKRYIASQGPNEIMLDDFVRMLWEQDVECVVMLTNLVEGGKKKCQMYWPKENETNFGDIRVRLATTQAFADYTIRILHLMKVGEPNHTLTQFHFTSWPDKDVPSAPWGLVDFEQRVSSQTTTKPIVVHCSAGVGRTGTFIALQNLLGETDETSHLDVLSTLKKLRKDRMHMIQTPNQYYFLHEAVRVALACRFTSVTSNNIAERITLLETADSSNITAMEKEFKTICTLIENAESGDSNGNACLEYHNCKQLANRDKNRFSNILPNEQYMPHLNSESNEMGNYINGVFVPSFSKHNHQILTQLPMPQTVVDFWRLVIEYQVSVVIALDVNSSEGDQTVADYLPTGGLKKAKFDPFEIENLKTKSQVDWEERKLKVIYPKKKNAKLSSTSGSQEEHHVAHLKCNHDSIEPKTLLMLVRKVKEMSSHRQGRIVYMCRNGADHSGLVCIASLLFARMDNDHHVTVPLVVGAIKAIRPQVIPTLKQYALLYKVMELYQDTRSEYINFTPLKVHNFDDEDKVNSPPSAEPTPKDVKEETRETEANVYGNNAVIQSTMRDTNMVARFV